MMNNSNCLIIGTGEYTTGFTYNNIKSDKKCGVVGIVYFDLRRRGLISNNIAFCGTNGKKFPQIRQHFKDLIHNIYNNMNIECKTFPNDDEVNNKAYIDALNWCKKGDIVNIFTPDDTHYDIALAAIERGLHVMITKPAVMTLEQHQKLCDEALKHNVYVQIEMHKRFDPMYNDAHNRIIKLGDFNYFNSYMSQPKSQLQTFKAWAGKSSDISYYLNSHHIDFHCWCMYNKAIPIKVTASASNGIAKHEIDVDCEDTITLLVEWLNLQTNNKGTAVYTASWSAPLKADVYSQQRFSYVGHDGEINIDQAHRGYTLASDEQNYASVNPLYMRYTPDNRGNFCGQHGYGYQSFESFVYAVNEINNNNTSPTSYNETLPTLFNTITVTAILEAGRRSLDEKRSIIIEYNNTTPIGFS